MCPQIRNILKQGIETPEDQNDLRKMQLRELARLNGTLREDDNRCVQLCYILVHVFGGVGAGLFCLVFFFWSLNSVVFNTHNSVHTRFD